MRELTEADIMSADEIKSFESGRDPAEVVAAEDVEKAEEDGEEDWGEDPSEETSEAEEDWSDETADAEIAASAEQDKEEVAEKVEAETALEANVEAAAATGADAKKETSAEPERKFTLAPDADDKEEEETEEVEGEPETEDELIAAFGPPVVPFERRPHTPFSSMNALAGGGRTAQSLAVAPTLPAFSFGQAPEAHAAVNDPAVRDESAAKGADWKEFRVQLHTGWFLAALVLLLALISFIAGMAVRRGALNQVLGEQQDSLIPKSSPAATVTPNKVTTSGVNATGVATAPGKPLSIEIVDLANHRWVIPASTGTNRAGGTAGAEVAVKTADEAQASRPKVSEDSAGGAATANDTKPRVPLVLNLPETPISASGSVAISAQRAVRVPADGSAAQSGRSLQVGQLLNVVEPVYPPEAIKDRVEGTVKLHAVVGSDGSIQSLTALSGPKALVDASMSAVHNWKYSPTRMGGQAIETEEDISFVFRLPN